MRKYITAYSNKDMITNHRIYSLFLQIGMDDGWSKEDKWENFELFTQITRLAHTPLNGSTILDIGCGTGDLVKYLADKGIQKYVGVDIFEPAIEKAQKQFPNQLFLSGDFLKMKFKEKFDFVFCSGALTTKLNTNNYKILTSWIPKMWNIATKGVVFNFLTENHSNTDILFLYNPKRVLKICQTYIPQANIATITTDAGSGDRSEEMHVYLY